MARKKTSHHYGSRPLRAREKADLSSSIPKDRTSPSLRAFDTEPRRLKREGAEDHRLDSTLGIYMENQRRVDDPVVTLEFEEDAQKLNDFLRTEEHLEFAPSFDTSTDVYEMVQLRIKPLENGRAAFSVHPNSSMTESQLKTISSDAYQLYVQIKDKRHKQQSTIPQSNYYKITFKLPSQYRRYKEERVRSSSSWTWENSGQRSSDKRVQTDSL